MRVAFTVAGLIFFSAQALALEVTAPTRVDAVTVFLSGAEVTRVAKVKLDKGDHTITFNDIPASAVAGSIRVEGKATGKLDIGSVDTARKYLARAESQAADAERKKIEDELEALRDQKTVLEAQVQAAETQKQLIANLAQLPTRPAPAAGIGATSEDWPRVLSQIAQGTTDASRLGIDAQLKIRDLDRKIEDLDKKLSGLAPAKTDQTEVRVYVQSGSPLEADFIVRYQVQGANWVPLYDARLQTGSKTAPAKLDLARRAAITQKSGENWDDVVLQLSTARPSEGASAPGIDTQTVDFEPELKPVPMAAPATRARRPENIQQDMEAAAAPPEMLGGANKMATAKLDEPQVVVETQAAVITAPFEATFAVAGLVTVPGNGDAKRVVLMTDALEPVLSARSVPKLDTNAYLYAKIKLPKGTPLLPGRVYLFRDGTFAGNAQLPLLQPGEDHDLGFGVDDQVKVKYAVLEEKRGETGLISTSHTDSRNFRTTLKNLHERPIQVTVLDRVPVSQNQDIKVEYTGKTPPTKSNFEEKRGVMSFEAKLEPDEERVLDYGYRISWPAAKSIIYGP
ncbi:MAG: mucoidy inhibitor MuiA family protein [Hyphomicrobium sp.]|nr:mucoidy inhibitor MuiA family protein [Hyphomicrobium sp.]